MEQSGWFKLENNGQAKAPAPKAQSAEVRKEPAPKTIMEEKYYPMQGKGLATKIPQPAAPLPSIDVYKRQELGGSIKVTGFVRYEKGEGLEKKEDNFADEVASMIK